MTKKDAYIGTAIFMGFIFVCIGASTETERGLFLSIGGYILLGLGFVEGILGNNKNE